MSNKTRTTASKRPTEEPAICELLPRGRPHRGEGINVHIKKQKNKKTKTIKKLKTKQKQKKSTTKVLGNKLKLWDELCYG